MNNDRRGNKKTSNEKNLLFLNEETSQYLDEGNNMDFAQENQHQEEVANLKYYILNKKLMEYEDKITNRNFQINTSSMMVENF
jgi:hypothetical protein